MGPVIRELEDPDGTERWGKSAPDDVAEHGPTDRALRWTAYFHRYGYAVSYNPTKEVEEMLKLPRSTAGRWIAASREAGYLGPSEGMGKAGGVVASIAKRPDGRWRARYRDAAGKEHSKHFDRKTDAQRWLDEVTAAIVTGQYVDPRSGRITFREYAERWRATQVHRLTTQVYIEGNLRRNAYPVFGDKPLSSIRPSEVQGWVKGMTDRLAPSTVGVVHGVVSGIFRAAVRDRLIVANPCDGTRLPKATPSRVEPLPVETVHALADALPARYRALVILAAGSGMRQGECLGLTVDRLDFLRRVVHVDRRLLTVTGRPSFLTAPKTAASVRTIPLPQVVLDALAAHLCAFPPLGDGFVFVTDARNPIRRTAFGDVWRAAVKAAGGPAGTGFHELRHFYASLLIRHGESVKTVQARLGHASASETLDTYSHLWPDSDDRTRTAVDSVLSADHVRTGEVIDEHNP